LFQAPPCDSCDLLWRLACAVFQLKCLRSKSSRLENSHDDTVILCPHLLPNFSLTQWAGSRHIACRRVACASGSPLQRVAETAHKCWYSRLSLDNNPVHARQTVEPSSHGRIARARSSRPASHETRYCTIAGRCSPTRALPSNRVGAKQRHQLFNS